MTPTSAPPVAWAQRQRQAAFEAWLAPLVAPQQLQPHSVRLASADASFRRYLRIDSANGPRIIMDAPPEHENCQPFVQVATLMREAGLHVPEVLAWDSAQGFMLLSDLGARTLMQTMHDTGQLGQITPHLPRYLQAIEALVAWQSASRPGVLAPYDEALLRRELALFPDWYIGRHRGLGLSDAQQATLAQAFDRIVADNLRWPQVYVHRDFMPRNLMVDGERLGVLDFQDAVYGPITYDIASLMRDAFLSWDEADVLDVTVRYWQAARRAGLPVGDDFGAFYQGVEWMGLQRHLKVAGIFARLSIRDGKPHYLADTPRFIAYIRATCSRYVALKPLLRLIDDIEGHSAPELFTFGRA